MFSNYKGKSSYTIATSKPEAISKASLKVFLTSLTKKVQGKKSIKTNFEKKNQKDVIKTQEY